MSEKKKRGNEHSQLSKEDYEGLQTAKTSPGTFRAASQQDMKKRRIVKARSPAPTSTTAAATSSSNSGSNSGGIFASVQLTAPTSKPFSFTSMTSNSSNAQASKPTNGLAVSSPSTSGFSFGGSSPPAAAPAAASPAPLVQAPVAAAATKPAPVTAATVDAASNKSQEIQFWEDKRSQLAAEARKYVMQAEKGSHLGEFAKSIVAIDGKMFLKQVDLQVQLQQELQAAANKTTAVTNVPPVNSLAAPAVTAAASSSPAAPAPAASSSPAAPAATSPAAAHQPPTAGGFAAPAAATAGGDPDWTDLNEFTPLNFLRNAQGSWTTFAKRAKLRLQQSTQDATKHRIVSHMEGSGKVQLNIALPKGTTFQYEAKQKKRGGTVGFVTFIGINGVDGAEPHTFGLLGATALAQDMQRELQAAVPK